MTFPMTFATVPENLYVRLEFGDCVKVMGDLEDASVDVILTDPPYGYLQHKLDRPFDEQKYFDEAMRLLKPTGFHVTFGRGTSFYRWNTELAKRGFEFKEEVIWSKRNSSGPGMRLQRFHETVSIYARNKSSIRKSIVPYLEARAWDMSRIQKDLERLTSDLNSRKTFEDMRNFVSVWEREGRAPEPEYTKDMATRHTITTGKGLKQDPHRVGILKAIAIGMHERSIMEVTREQRPEHPTQKPVRLMERLLLLVSDPGMTVFDPFMGSGTTGLACMGTGRHFIGCEILPEYFEMAIKRLQEGGCAPSKPGYEDLPRCE